MRFLFTLLSGSIFGFGLALSGMMNPARVRGFLDIFGDWDPTLAFVMGGAVLVMAVAWFIQRRMSAPMVGEEFNLPGTRLFDGKLIGGSALFGIGWGLAGLCPGPAISSLATSPIPALVFVGSMAVGVAAHRIALKA
ncbi:YeeE/YedE family protein [Qipengyuania sp. G39]|uniref:YeeE/YedE family protein n=1 Tax=Qipengyuania profundimaris TaxID=3067652 RepID=A0ABT9HNT9_9SPHN|nr:DUF6691 family protein [Qipengyuania sp. G39]MDP4574812.1 YeeE/YedE family protein [Qipengyuania sp. G39]